MKKLVDYLKGFSIGVANIVAGLSGGTVAVMCNCYDDLLDLFSNIATHLVKTVKKHFRLIIGILLGLIIGALVLKKLYDNIPLPLTAFFAGIVLFSLFPLAKDLNIKESKKINIIFIIIPIVILISLPFLTESEDNDLTLSVNTLIIVFFLGIIASTAMIIPGVSGSMILLAIGYYYPVLSLVYDIMNSIITFSFDNLYQNIIILLFLVIGFLIGLIFVSKLIRYLLNRFKYKMQLIIYGLIAGSFIAMIIEGYMLNKGMNYLNWLNIFVYCVSIVLIVVGFFVGYFIEKMAIRMSTRKNESEIISMKEFNMDDFLKMSDEVWPNFKKSLKDLVAFPSVLEEYKENSDEPFGKGNKDALNYMLNLGKEDGFNVLNQDNYAGHISFGKGEESLGLLAHLDVVPVAGQKWSSDPFTVAEHDGKLFGRGVNDDKGPLLAAYYAIKLLKDNGFVPSKEIKLIMGCDEESGSRCLQHYFKYNPTPTIGFSPDAEFPCINGEKAHLEFDITGKLEETSPIETFYSGERPNIVPEEAHMTLKDDYSKEYVEFLKDKNYKGEFKDGTYYAYGLAAHAMNPEKGFNASFILFEFLNQVAPCELSKYMVKYFTFDTTGSKLGINKTDEIMGSLTENCGMVRIKNSYIKIVFDCRVPLDEMEITIREQLFNSLKETKNLSFDMPPMTPVHYVDKDSFLVKELLKAYQEATGDTEHGAVCIGGGTYAKLMPSAVAFGPQFIGREAVDHQADEYIYESDYRKIIAIYAKSIYELSK